VPGLRSLYFVAEFGIPPWTTILPILTPAESRAVIFPDLQEIAFFGDPNYRYEQECFDESYNLLRDFVLARERHTCLSQHSAHPKYEYLKPTERPHRSFGGLFHAFFFWFYLINLLRCQHPAIAPDLFIRNLRIKGPPLLQNDRTSDLTRKAAATECL
jgi:hypothetical protein